jgi:hypothetical protein
MHIYDVYHIYTLYKVVHNMLFRDIYDCISLKLISVSSAMYSTKKYVFTFRLSHRGLGYVT